MSRRILFERIPGPLAPVYEKATRLVIGTYYAPLAEEIAPVLNEGAILDLGTGPGYLPIEIVKRSPRITVTGIDLSDPLIRTARRNVLRARVADQVEFAVANAAHLPFDDCSFDMVISTGMLHMLRDPVAVLKECFRVLNHQGRAWIYDPAQVASLVDKGKWVALLTPLERILYRAFGLYTRINPARTYTREELARMIKQTDFTQWHLVEKDGEMRLKLLKTDGR